MSKKNGTKRDATPIKVGTVVDVDKVAFKVAERRSSMYDGVFSAMAKLKSGQSFVVPCPKNVELQVLHNRLNAAVRRGPVQPPTGCVFRKRTTVDGSLAICCLPEAEADAKIVAPKAKKAKK